MIAAATFHPYRLPLVRPWVDAGLTLAERSGVLVRVMAEGGTAGWGDCAPLPGRTEDLTAALAALTGAVARLPGQPLGRALAGLALPSCPAARCGLETALLDLDARRRGLPLAGHLSPGTDATSVMVNAVLGTLDAHCAARARGAQDAGFGVAKVKVGIGDWREEARDLRRLAEEVTALRFRLDANRAWSEDDAAGFLAAVADLPVEAVEDPLAAPDFDALGRLQARVPFPLALDESVPSDADAALASQAVRRLVLKPTALGGPLAALALARRARAKGIETVVTSSLDSAIGVTAAAHLAAALGEGPAHGLATLDWLGADVAPRPALSAGRLRLPAGAGIGLVPFRQTA
ncbi:MAG: o-succinylbenzoate synthase [Magnetospirillum sp.]|nr:o-succinylbenzoate synthase [Magnetospirillum sp.]